MSDPEIYRDPQRDVALVDLSPHIRLSIPMYLFAKYGTLHADWDELNKKIKEIYELLFLGSDDSKTSLVDALGIEKDG